MSKSLLIIISVISGLLVAIGAGAGFAHFKNSRGVVATSYVSSEPSTDGFSEQSIPDTNREFFTAKNPHPPASPEEIKRDVDLGNDLFSSGEWQSVSKDEALAFAYLKPESQCPGGKMWLRNVERATDKDRFELKAYPGRAGIFRWYAMRMLNEKGQMVGALGQVGERLDQN